MKFKQSYIFYITNDVLLSLRSSILLSLKISITTELFEFYSSGNITTGPGVIFGYSFGGWDTPNYKKNLLYF